MPTMLTSSHPAFDVIRECLRKYEVDINDFQRARRYSECIAARKDFDLRLSSQLAHNARIFLG